MAQFYGMQHLPRRDLGDLRRTRLAAAAARPDQEGAGTAPRAPSAPGAPTSSPTAPRPPTRSWCRRWCEPGDIVLVDRDCHKSHHYGMVLAGAQVVYLDSYPLDEYSMYGAVPLREIKATAAAITSSAGKLDRVRMLLLTNCTFDGIVYDVERVMEECLAIKPDLVFLWDEAWFAFAGFTPTYRRRTAMATRQTPARSVTAARSTAAEYEAHRQRVADQKDDEAGSTTRLLPDPAEVRVRVYATQSTHKTLTSLRQGSMIHVYDQDFRNKVAGAVPRGLHDAHLDLAELPDPGLARRRPAPGRAGRLRAGAEADRAGDDAARARRLAPAAEQVLPLPARRRHDSGRVPPVRGRALLRPGDRLEREQHGRRPGRPTSSSSTRPG